MAQHFLAEERIRTERRHKMLCGQPLVNILAVETKVAAGHPHKEACCSKGLGLPNLL